MRRRLVLLALLGAIAALPAAGQGLLDRLTGPKVTWPPDRSAWAALPPQVRAAHARALHLALEETPPGAARDWAAAGVSGRIAPGRPAEFPGAIMCRAFDDALTVQGRTLTVRDVACWGDGWRYMLPEGRTAAVLAPAFAEAARVHEVRRAETLRQLAKRLRVDEAALAALNPAHPARIPVGTLLLLP